jgi:[acyl-carrier-protein] S-malonyltransferase
MPLNNLNKGGLMSRAFVFPGQGAQTIGMGRALASAYPAAKAVFDEVDDALGEPLSALIWNGDIADLTLTQNAQPALMATSIAALRALAAEGMGMETVSLVAGHSLGEYSALCAAGALTLTDTARLLRARGLAMQEAVPVGVGAMAAILGLDFETVTALAAEAAEDEVCQAANDNDPGQVVISGHAAAVARAMVLAKAAGAKRALALPVSAPFHCTLMQHAATEMAEALAAVVISKPVCPVVMNVRAEGIEEPSRFRDLLIAQITGVVRWRESVEWMERAGVSEYYEVGAGKALSGMIKRIIEDEAVIRAIGTPEDVAALRG